MQVCNSFSDLFVGEQGNVVHDLIYAFRLEWTDMIASDFALVLGIFPWRFSITVKEWLGFHHARQRGLSPLSHIQVHQNYSFLFRYGRPAIRFIGCQTLVQLGVPFSTPREPISGPKRKSLLSVCGLESGANRVM